MNEIWRETEFIIIVNESACERRGREEGERERGKERKRERKTERGRERTRQEPELEHALMSAEVVQSSLVLRGGQLLSLQNKSCAWPLVVSDAYAGASHHNFCSANVRYQ